MFEKLERVKGIVNIMLGPSLQLSGTTCNGVSNIQPQAMKITLKILSLSIIDHIT